MKLGPYWVEWVHRASMRTICSIFNETPPKQSISSGSAYCSPKDNFSKEIGRKLTLARAIKKLDLSYEIRAQIWKDYFNRVRRND
jgi:hypothetical protein